MSVGRGGQRGPSRTPPFILVGLLVVLSFLGYSYWSLSSSNADLSSQLKAVHLEKRETEKKGSQVERELAYAKGKWAELEQEKTNLTKILSAKDNDIHTLKADLQQKMADDEKQRSLMERCDEKLAVVQKDLESANAEKSNLQHTLDAEREKTAVCSMETCQEPVQQVLTVVSKLVGSVPIQKALVEAHFDGQKLMEGINIPPPVAEKQPQQEEKKQQLEQKQNLQQQDQQTQPKHQPTKSATSAMLDQVNPEQPRSAAVAAVTNKEAGANEHNTGAADPNNAGEETPLSQVLTSTESQAVNPPNDISAGADLNQDFNIKASDDRNRSAYNSHDQPGGALEGEAKYGEFDRSGANTFVDMRDLWKNRAASDNEALEEQGHFADGAQEGGAKYEEFDHPGANTFADIKKEKDLWGNSVASDNEALEEQGHLAEMTKMGSEEKKQVQGEMEGNERELQRFEKPVIGRANEEESEGERKFSEDSKPKFDGDLSNHAVFAETKQGLIEEDQAVLESLRKVKGANSDLLFGTEKHEGENESDSNRMAPKGDGGTDMLMLGEREKRGI